METSKYSMADQCVRLHASLTLIVHGALCTVLLWLFVYYARHVSEQFVSFGQALPASFLLFFSVRGLVEPCFPLLVPMALALLWLDGRVFLSLCRRRSERAVLLWSAGITLTLILVLAMSLWALDSPFNWMNRPQIIR